MCRHLCILWVFADIDILERNWYVFIFSILVKRQDSKCGWCIVYFSKRIADDLAFIPRILLLAFKAIEH